MKKIIKGLYIGLSLFAIAAASMACGSEKQSTSVEKKLKLVLDWTPNTNHTGLYVAMDKGYYKDAGIELEIVQPPEDGAEVLVASGKADFGISFQDTMAGALSKDSPLPIKAVAAITQHNTSGIMSRKGDGITTPKGLEGKKYATWDLPIEKAILKNVVEKDGGDFAKVELIPSTVTDEVSALSTKQIDAVWVYYGWAGISAKEKGFDFDYFAFKDINPTFDYYTPVLITNDDMIKNNSDTVKKFLEATKKGYEFAAGNPQDAAEILLKYAPEIDSKLANASQEYLSTCYIDKDIPWGYIDSERWRNFYRWINENNLLEHRIDEGAGLDNEFITKQ
ncbi:NMT1/THI5-like protein [Lachnoanaerobaculum saburreum F0468]|uniref:NMT1/THI5-like protein n=1 Tax=Lachnoanaerobaculum saburreum F0468 TaxID=1095750 RepID=I0R7B3_9FIRM|nr:ABC transporter substrate-binding protein [Lachnoanaerobaculum saburreum]EIC95571.1 NMT1/THI5-like protein [Lachnoanaerobaculum saburreum F0468]